MSAGRAPRTSRTGADGIAGLVADAVLVAGARLVEAVLPRREGTPASPTDPRQVRDRLLRAVALGAVVMVSRRVLSVARLPLRRTGRGHGRPAG